MPPEAVKNCVYYNRTDVWAFGVFVFELLHGESPYARSYNIDDLFEKMNQPLR